MSQRLGIYTLTKLAHRMCKYVVQFTPALRAAFPENATLLLALETANAACAALGAELEAVATPGV